MLKLLASQKNKLMVCAAGIDREETVPWNEQYPEWLQERILAKIKVYIYLMPTAASATGKSPFISVCIPAYCRPQHLLRLLASLATQTYRDFEVILTDDSPDDGVHAVAREFRQLGIQYRKNARQLGSPANWNEALGIARGEWVQLMHSDDWYGSNDSLQRFADRALQTRHDFIFSASREVDAQSGRVKLLRIGRKEEKILTDPVNLLFENVIGHPSVVLHRRDAGLRYDSSFQWVVDIDFYIRYLTARPGYEFIDEPLVNIGVDESMISHWSYKNPDVEIPEYLHLLQKFPADLPARNPFAFYCLWKLVKKFGIRGQHELRAHGYHGPPVEAIEFIAERQRRIPRLLLKQTGPSDYLMKKAYSAFIRRRSRAF